MLKFLTITHLHAIIDLFHKRIFDGDEKLIRALCINPTFSRIEDKVLAWEAQNQLLSKFNKDY